MDNVKLSAAFAVLLSMPIAAQADWQYTKWGMTAEQALRVSGGQLRTPAIQERAAHAAGDRQPELVGQHATSSFRFTAALFFGAAPRSGCAVFMVSQSSPKSIRWPKFTAGEMTGRTILLRCMITGFLTIKGCRLIIHPSEAARRRGFSPN
jgi:hypothetical protein